MAAAPRGGELRPVVAWACLALVVAGSALVAFVGDSTYRRVSPEKPPEALADRAGEIIARLGYSDPVTDTASWFSWDESVIRYLAEEKRSRGRGSAPDASESQAITFWFRQSPASLAAEYTDGQVRPSDPPETVPGMVAVNLDSRGRLLQLRAVPPRLDPSRGPSPEPDWSALFTEAALDLSKFAAIEPTFTPPFHSDRRAAWEGVDPHRENRPLHLEAAAFHGRPVWFQVMGPWAQAAATKRLATASDTSRKVVAFTYVLLVLAILGGLVLVRRSRRRGLGDSRGAFRIALWMFVSQLLSSLLRAHHVPLFNIEFERFVHACGSGLFFAAVVWILYIALEPVVRRHWPEMLVSWSRLLAGGFRDPLVGRDVLLGCVAGVVTMLLTQLLVLAGFPLPMQRLTRGLSGARLTVSGFLFHQGDGLLLAFAGVFLLVLFRIVLTREWLAIGAWIALAAVPAAWFEHQYAGLALMLVLGAFMAAVMIRVGLLAVYGAVVTRYVLMLFPVTLRFSSWYSGLSVFGFLLVAAIAVYGLVVSLAGKPMFGVAILEE